MVFAFIGWILLLLRPSWGMLMFLANCVGVLQLGLSYINIMQRLDEFGERPSLGTSLPESLWITELL